MNKISLRIAILVIFCLSIYSSVSHAALSASSQTVNSGEKVVISVNSSQALGAYTVSVSDNGGLTFVTSSGQEGSGKTTISGSSTSGVTSLATFTFQTPNVTEDKKFNVTIKGSGMETPSLEGVANSTATVTITVKAPASNNTESNTNTSNTASNNTTENKKSSNANLSNLIVSPVDFTGFKASKTSGYSVTVDNKIEEVKITAKPQDSKAKVTVSGNKKLKVGNNTVSVLVTAEDGTKKTYTVTVKRKDKTEESQTTTNEVVSKETQTQEVIVEEVPIEENKNQGESIEEFGITSIKLIGLTKNEITIEPNIVPEFNLNTYSYTTTITSDVEHIKVEAIANDENAQIEIMGNENLVVGENIITILVKSANGDKQHTYQITVNKTEETLDLTHDTQKGKMIIIGIIIAILSISIIIAIVSKIKRVKSANVVKRIDEEHSYTNFSMLMDSEAEENDKNSTKSSFNGKKNGKRFK